MQRLMLTLVLMAADVGAQVHQPAGVRSPAFHGSAIAEINNGVLFVISSDGKTTEVKLPARYRFAASRFSQDGRSVAGVSGGTFTVLDDSLRELWRLATGTRNAFSLSLSPDREKIAFAYAPSGPDRRTAKMWRLSVLDRSGAEHRLGEFYYGESLEEPAIVTWDPSGKRIALSDGGQIRVLDVDSGDDRIVGSGLDPSWSPDGRWIAYRSASGRIGLLDGDGKATKTIPLGDHVMSFARWSPDSSAILVGEGRGQTAGCSPGPTLVVYTLSSHARQLAYDACGRRDWYFGWISDPMKWISSATALQRAKQ